MSLTGWNDPKVIVAILALALNVLVTGVSIYVQFSLFIKRRREEREYQFGHLLFKILILDDLKGYFTFCNNVEIEFKKLCLSQSKDPRSEIEATVEKVDELYYRFRDTVVVQSRGVSNEMHANLQKITLQFYDDGTDILTSLSTKQSADKSHILTSRFENTKHLFITEVLGEIRLKKPSVD
jgi:hypothetical protein